MKKINYEKISVYIACLSVAVMLWASLMSIKDDIANIRERIAKLEVKVEKLEEKK